MRVKGGRLAFISRHCLKCNQEEFTLTYSSTIRRVA